MDSEMVLGRSTVTVIAVSQRHAYGSCAVGANCKLTKKVKHKMCMRACGAGGGDGMVVSANAAINECIL